MGPSILGKTAASAFSTNALSRFASVALDGVLGPLRLAGRSMPLKGTVSSQIALHGSETDLLGVSRTRAQLSNAMYDEC